tara:strand:+ start:4402 stop:4866 length:465 start_codon:yes stop_codon:yes gene_type:complete
MFDEVFEMMNNNEIFKKNFNGIYPLVDHNIFKLMFIGISTGLVASFVGGGAEILIVPLLVYLKVVTDYKVAIGTSLASLLLPIGIVAVFFFAKEICNNNKGNCIKWNYALTLSFFFVIGTLASYFTSKIDTRLFKSMFGVITVLLGGFILFDNN